MKKTNTITIDNEISELTNKQAMLLTAASYALRLAFVGLLTCSIGFVITILGVHELWIYCTLECLKQIIKLAGTYQFISLFKELLLLSFFLTFPIILLRSMIIVFLESKNSFISIEKNENGINYKIEGF